MRNLATVFVLLLLLAAQGCSSANPGQSAGLTKFEPCPPLDNHRIKSLKTPCEKVDGKFYIVR